MNLKMGKLILAGAVIVAIVLLGLPYMSFSMVGDDDYDMELSLEVTATCSGYLETAYYTHTQTYDELIDSGYWDYLDGYWSFGSSNDLPEYPYLSVIVQGEYDYDSRQVWRTPYVYGETIEWTGQYPTYHDEVLLIELHIVHEQGYTSSISWKEIVP